MQSLLDEGPFFPVLSPVLLLEPVAKGGSLALQRLCLEHIPIGDNDIELVHPRSVGFGGKAPKQHRSSLSGRCSIRRPESLEERLLPLVDGRTCIKTFDLRNSDRF
jgi:hypothetical protein